MTRLRYWTGECRYEGREPFYFHSPRFCVVDDSELAAAEQLQRIFVEEWARISPHSPPVLVCPIPGRLVADEELQSRIKR